MRPVDHPVYIMLQRIVMGQVRSYMTDHPGSITETFPDQAVQGITKRVVHDLWAQRERLRLALGASPGADAVGCGTVLCDQPIGDGAEYDAASSGAGGGI